MVVQSNNHSLMSSVSLCHKVVDRETKNLSPRPFSVCYNQIKVMSLDPVAR